MQQMLGLVPGTVVEVRGGVGGHPALGVSVGSRPAAVSWFCPLLVGYAPLGQGNRAFRCVERGRRRGPRGDPSARCLFARGLFSGRYGCRGRAILLG